MSFSDFLVNILGVEDVGATLYGKATYHDSCAALRECRIKEEPRKLLSRVKGLELLEMNDVETCCGFGGSFAVKFESISIAMADQKVNNALQTGADYIISTDISCSCTWTVISGIKDTPSGPCISQMSCLRKAKTSEGQT